LGPLYIKQDPEYVAALAEIERYRGLLANTNPDLFNRLETACKAAAEAGNDLKINLLWEQIAVIDIQKWTIAKNQMVIDSSTTQLRGIREESIPRYRNLQRENQERCKLLKDEADKPPVVQPTSTPVEQPTLTPVVQPTVTITVTADPQTVTETTCPSQPSQSTAGGEGSQSVPQASPTTGWEVSYPPPVYYAGV
jgi:hypothetical protein